MPSSDGECDECDLFINKRCTGPVVVDDGEEDCLDVTNGVFKRINNFKHVFNNLGGKK